MQKKPPSFKAISTFSYNQLAGLYAQVSDYQKLKHKISLALPQLLAQQVLHCAIKNKTLIIYTGSSVWSSQIRFYQSALLATLPHSAIKQVDSLQVKVIAMQMGASPNKAGSATLPSVETIGIIQKQIETLSEDALKKSLHKLIHTLKNVSINNANSYF